MTASIASPLPLRERSAPTPSAPGEGAAGGAAASIIAPAKGDPPLVQPVDSEPAYAAFVDAVAEFRTAPGPAARGQVIQTYRRWVDLYCPDASPAARDELVASTVRRLDAQATSDAHLPPLAGEGRDGGAQTKEDSHAA